MWISVGNAAGTTIGAGASDESLAADRVIQHGTDLFLHADAGDVRRLNQGTGDWELQQALSLDFLSSTGILRVSSSAVPGFSAYTPP
jgi:hypothetical protein